MLEHESLPVQLTRRISRFRVFAARILQVCGVLNGCRSCGRHWRGTRCRCAVSFGAEDIDTIFVSADSGPGTQCDGAQCLRQSSIRKMDIDQLKGGVALTYHSFNICLTA